MKEFFVDVKAYTLAKPLNCKGTFQKLLSGFCPLRGGEYPPFPLRVFGQDDFPLRGGGGYPPIPLRKIPLKRQVF